MGSINFYKFFILLILITSCNSKRIIKNKQDTGVVFEILNKKVKFGDTIIVKVHNKSKNNIYFPIDHINRGIINNLRPSEYHNFYPTIISSGIISLSINSNIVNNDKLTNVFIINNLDSLTIIEKESTKIIKIPLNSFKLADNSKVSYILNKKGNYKLKIKYTIKKEVVEFFLNQELKINLDNNYIKCFNGRVESKSVKFIVE